MVLGTGDVLHLPILCWTDTRSSWSHAGGRGEATSFCTRCALSESSLEAIAAGRAEYAGQSSDTSSSVPGYESADMDNLRACWSSDMGQHF
jgi:hypothetical protein